MGQPFSSVRMLNEVITTVTSEVHVPRRAAKRTFQARGQTTAGAGAATILVEVSNDNSQWANLGTITLTLSTTTSTDGFASDAAWRYVRARISAISGTNAAVSVWMGA